MCKYIILSLVWLLSLVPGQILAYDSNRFSIVSQNLNRFYNDKDDGKNEKVLTTRQYRKRQLQLVRKIVTEFNQPDLLALQEVENIDVLHDISKMLYDSHGISYLPLLVEGNDPAGIDVGYLIKDNWQVKSLTSLFKMTVYNKQGAKLFSRPPLVIELCAKKCFTIMNLHLRSMRGLRSEKKSRRIALKRQRQSESIARWVDKFQKNNPESHLIIAGDFNALTPSDSYVDSVGTIKGKPDRKRPRYKSPDLVSKDLLDITKRVKSRDRYSFKYKGKRQQLDYILISSNLARRVKSIRFSGIEYDFSDHAAVLASFKLH